MSETVITPKPNAPTPTALGATQKSVLSQIGSSTFDRTKHVPFRIDNKGMNKEMALKDQIKGLNIKTEEETKIPQWWTRGDKTNPNRTLTEVRNNRRAEFVPDISFDLDGDGVVGNRDLVISKLFDKDGDGRLNTGERKNAVEAIKNVSRSLAN